MTRLPILNASEKRVTPKSPPVWTGFGLNGSADAARFDLTRRYVEKYQKGLKLTDPNAFAFLRQPLRDLLIKDSSSLVQLDKDQIKIGEDLLIGFVHDYESAVSIRNVDLTKHVEDGAIITFMSGAGLVLGFQKNAGWRLVSSFPFMTKVALPIVDIKKSKETSVDLMDKCYNIYSESFVKSLNRFNKWRDGYASNYFARVVSASIGKNAQPKVAEFQIEKLLTSELLGHLTSARVCDDLEIPLIPFQDTDALAKRYSTKFSESMLTQDVIEIPSIDLEFEIMLADITKDKVPSRQKGIITIKRTVLISFRVFDRFGSGPEGRKKILQMFARSSEDEDKISFNEPGDDTPERDFVFFEQILGH
jgi:hypothetical protein